MKLPVSKSKLGRALVLTIAATLSLSALAACSKQQQADDTERVLRIATLQGYGNEDEWFRQQFTELYEFANPNVKIEIVPAVNYNMYQYYSGDQPQEQPNPLEELKKLMQGDNPPDLVMMEFNNLSELVAENLLMPLDPLISADKYDTTKIVPTVLEGIKEAAPDGKLYALAPLFSSSALFYNKNIFQEKGIAPPTDNMTWDEVFALARQLSGGEGADQKFGFSFQTYMGSDPFWDMSMYTQPLQLSYYDQTGDKMAVDSDSWESVWKTITELRQQNIIPGQPNYDEMYNNNRQPGPFDWDNFLSGRTAMAISSYYYINELIQAQRRAEADENLQVIDWDVVTVPVHAQAPGIGGQIYLQGMMGINAKAQNDKDAWAFMKFVNGEDWARLKSRSQSTLVSNKDYLQPKEGMSYNISAFYQLKPAPIQDEMNMWRKYPNLYMVQSIGQQKFQEVLNGDKEVRQALKEWQTEGDAMLQQMRDDPNFQGNWGEPMPMPMPIEEVVEQGAEAEAAPAE